MPTDLAHQHTSTHQAAGNPTQRFPSAALRQHIQIQDRSCIMIDCRAPTHHTNTDHTHDHTHDGTTTEPNPGTPCRHDHHLKHESG